MLIKCLINYIPYVNYMFALTPRSSAQPHHHTLQNAHALHAINRTFTSYTPQTRGLNVLSWMIFYVNCYRWKHLSISQNTEKVNMKHAASMMHCRAVPESVCWLISINPVIRLSDLGVGMQTHKSPHAFAQKEHDMFPISPQTEETNWRDDNRICHVHRHRTSSSILISQFSCYR